MLYQYCCYFYHFSKMRASLSTFNRYGCQCFILERVGSRIQYEHLRFCLQEAYSKKKQYSAPFRNTVQAVVKLL